MRDLVGQVIRGYEITELMGKGGFGAVYRAHQAAVGREVVIKIILPQYANKPEFIRRFEAEAQLVARLEHLHIVPLYDYWREPSGAYLVMRYLRGGTLRESLNQQAWSPRATARLLSQIGAALMVAHRNNVIHRDIKPSNILLDDDGNAYLSDFGIAIDVMASSSGVSRRTLTGSAGYISPEQINMQPALPQSDIYSMGIMLWEMLMGRHPFPDEKTPVALFVRHVRDPLPRMEGFPATIEAVLHKATAKNPADRYADFMEFAHDFKTAVLESGIADMPGVNGIPTSVIDFATLEITPVPVEEAVQNPYKGLRAFQESDAEDFFGREALIQQLLARLAEDHPLQRFLAVVGPSGSGKSSVVKAGLMPALRKGALPGSANWFIQEMMPSREIFTELENTLLHVAAEPQENLSAELMSSPSALGEVIKRILPAPDSELVLVIDQFEQIFTLIAEEQERVLFLDSLQAAVTDPESRLRLIVTVRADFYDRPLMYPGFSSLIQQRTEVVLPLTAEELERAITLPARRARVSFQQGLPALIVSQVNEQPGVLPMLQYALTELFERREGYILTQKVYHEIGGVLGALARRAEEIYAKLPDDQQEAARQLFLRLVTLGEGTEDTRRRALQSELIFTTGNMEVMQDVIERFGSYRLLTFDRDPVTRTPTIEVAHEALIREWRRLREWLDESREDVRVQRILGSAAAEWEASNRDSSFLLRGGRLVQFEEWAATNSVALTSTEREYLQTSITERERLTVEEQERQAKELELERRSRQRLRFIVITLLIAAIMGVVLSGAVFNQSRNAQRERDRAQAAQVQAQTQAALAINNAATATIAQGEAQEQAVIAQTQAALAINNAATATIAQGQAQEQAVIAQTQAALAINNAATATIAQGQAQQQAVIAQTQAALAFNNAATATIAQGQAQEQAVIAQTQAALAFNNAATATIAQGQAQEQAALAINNAATATIAQGQAQQQAVIAQTQAALAFNNAATATLAQGQAQMEAANAQTQASIASTAQSDAQEQALIAQREAEVSRSLGLAASANQLIESNTPLALALAIEANSVPQPSLQAQQALLAVVYEAPRRRFLSNGSSINSIAVSPDGLFMVTAEADGKLRLWEVSSGRLVRVYEGHAAAVRDAVFSPDAQYILSGGEDAAVILWDAATGEIIQRFAGHSGAVNAVAYSPNGQTIISGGQDGNVIQWNREDGSVARVLTARAGDPINDLSYSPNGGSILVSANAAMFILSGGSTLEFEESPARVRNSVFSPDGALILTTGDFRNGTAQLWDTRTRALLRSLPAHNGAVNSVAFSPDGQTALTASDDFTLILSDVATGAELRRFRGHTTSVNSVAFTPDGQYVLSGANSGVIYLWDIAPIAQTRQFAGHTSAVSFVAFEPNSSQIVSAADDGTLRVWDAATGERLLSRNLGRPSIPQMIFRFSPQTHEGNPILLWGATELHLMDLTSGRELMRFVAAQNRAWVEDAAFSPDGKQVLWGGAYFFREQLSEFTRASLLTLWDVETGEVIRQFEGHAPDAPEGYNAAVTAVAFSPDGRLIASGAEDATLILWDAQTGERLREFAGHSDLISSLTFSPDGQFLLSGSNDTTMILWRVSSGELLRRFTGHQRGITSLAFSTDGLSILSGSLDARMNVWDTSTGQLLRSFSGRRGGINSLAFSPDGSRALSGGVDGSVILWNIETAAYLLEWAKSNRFIPELTCAEREQYRVLPLCETAPTPSPNPSP